MQAQAHFMGGRGEGGGGRNWLAVLNLKVCFKCCGLQIPVPSDYDYHAHVALVKSCESNAVL